MCCRRFLFATGAGAGARWAVGVVAFWGVTAATFIGILFVPPLYVLAESLGKFPKIGQ